MRQSPITHRIPRYMPGDAFLYPENHSLGEWFEAFLTSCTPGYAGGEKELIARGGVDKKKSPS